jgi:hypothetical protein
MSENQKMIISCRCSKREMPVEEFREKVAEWMKPFGQDFTIMPNVTWQCMKCFDVCNMEVVDEANSP